MQHEQNGRFYQPCVQQTKAREGDSSNVGPGVAGVAGVVGLVGVGGMHRKSPPPERAQVVANPPRPDPTRQDETRRDVSKMEDDRAQTNLGPAAEEGVPEEAPAAAAAKQPRRRFVGRKKTVGSVADATTSIEDSSAIQGVRQPWDPSRPCLLAG